MEHETKTLKQLVIAEMESQGESKDDIVNIVIGPHDEGRGPETSTTESFEDLEKFEGKPASVGGKPLPGLYMWTTGRVYFKETYDGMEQVGSVPRNPTEDEEPHAIGK